MINLILSITLLVSPLKFEISTYPGVVNKKLVVRNGDKNNSIRVRVYTSDWNMNTGGDISYFPPGSLTNSCSEWMSVNPREFTLPPEGKREVRLSIQIPEDTEGSYWSVLFFQGQLPQDEEWTPFMRVAGRIGISTYLEIAGTTRREGAINDIFLRGDDVIVEFENQGNRWLRPDVRFWIKRSKEVIFSDSVSGAVILPEKMREFKFITEKANLKNGDSIFTRIDYGGDKILEGVKEVESLE